LLLGNHALFECGDEQQHVVAGLLDAGRFGIGQHVVEALGAVGGFFGGAGGFELDDGGFFPGVGHIGPFGAGHQVVQRFLRLGQVKLGSIGIAGQLGERFHGFAVSGGFGGGFGDFLGGCLAFSFAFAGWRAGDGLFASARTPATAFVAVVAVGAVERFGALQRLEVFTAAGQATEFGFHVACVDAAAVLLIRCHRCIARGGELVDVFGQALDLFAG